MIFFAEHCFWTKIKIHTFGKHWLLSSELFQNFSSSRQTISTLTNTNVQAQFPNAELFHNILFLGFLPGLKQNGIIAIKFPDMLNLFNKIMSEPPLDT